MTRLDNAQGRNLAHTYSLKDVDIRTRDAHSDTSHTSERLYIIGTASHSNWQV